MKLFKTNLYEAALKTPVSDAFPLVAHGGLTRKELLVWCLLSLLQNLPARSRALLDAGTLTCALITCMASFCRTAGWN